MTGEKVGNQIVFSIIKNYQEKAEKKFSNDTEKIKIINEVFGNAYQEMLGISVHNKKKKKDSNKTIEWVMLKNEDNLYSAINNLKLTDDSTPVSSESDKIIDMKLLTDGTFMWINENEDIEILKKNGIPYRVNF